MIDQVAFAGAHNAMSNVSIPDWLFPHHEAGIEDQLVDGVRAFLIDVYVGFDGAVADARGDTLTHRYPPAGA